MRFALLTVISGFLSLALAQQKLNEIKSEINSVKLYQNKAQVNRRARVALKQGENRFILTGLPAALYDWSIKGRLPRDFQARILSLEIEKKALLEKRQKKIVEIEKKLEVLKEEDQQLLDDLRNLHSQKRFLDSIISFTNQNVAKELMTRTPQVQTWDRTLTYVSTKRKSIQAEKRRIEKKRENLGKKIQKWEFELSQLAGRRYFNQYQNYNKIVLNNRAQLQSQQFGLLNQEYTKKRRLLSSPGVKIETEKRLIVSVFASSARMVDFNFNYIVPYANWKMRYDLRASAQDSKLDLVVYGDLYQKTGEDWNNVDLLLSTGAPQNVLRPAVISSWYLNARRRRVSTTSSVAGYAKKESAKDIADVVEEDKGAGEIPRTQIRKKGPSVEIKLPLKQKVQSSTKRQKKFIKEHEFKNKSLVKFFYEITPQVNSKSFIKTKITNRTQLPFLSGEAQLFLENEFMGKVKIPYTPVGKSQEIILGNDDRITGKKVLDKKFEDTGGLFGGNRRLRYNYRLDLENNADKTIELWVIDAIPVSRNKKITTKIEKLSMPFFEDKKFKKSSDYHRGLRKWQLTLQRGEKRTITYQVVIEFDKKLRISGLR